MGKSASKLKSKRSQSIAWSFRFPSINSLQNFGTSRRQKKGFSKSLSCRDLRFNNNRNKNNYNRNSNNNNNNNNNSYISNGKDLIIKSSENIIAAKENDSTYIVVTTVKRRRAAEEDVLPQQHRQASNGGGQDLVANFGDDDEDDDDEDEGDDGSRTPTPATAGSTTPTSIEPHEVARYEDCGSGEEEEPVRGLLERELRLFDLFDSRDIRSFAWYHGSTLPSGRRGAEQEIPNDGDFLVRDCTSQPGNYVLSVRHKGQPLHFVINKVILQADTVYERVQYQFEDEAFDTVADLITFYVGNKKPVSQMSGARIVNPRPRRVPLGSSPYESPSPSSCSSLIVANSPPHLMRGKYRSYSLTPQQQQQYPFLPPNYHHQQHHANHHQSSSTLPRAPPNTATRGITNSLSLGRQRSIVRGVSDPSLIHQQQSQNHYQTPRNSHWGSAPPKPPKIPNHPKPAQRLSKSHFHSGSDSGNGSGDSEFETHHHQQPIKGVVIRSHHAQDPLGADFDYNQWEALEAQLIESAPIYEIPSAFALDDFKTVMLPPYEHKPLDATTLYAILEMLRETAPRLVAAHITKVDESILLRPFDDASGIKAGLCGLELVAMPYAQQLRFDLIERTECLKLLVAVTVLTGQSAAERAAVIAKWIQVAIDIKTALGNLYGFCSVMLGLCVPQIQNLQQTWHLLRQKHTDAAFNFEAKLRPMLRAMNECTDPQAPNTTIPHIMPVVLLSERTMQEPLGTAYCKNLNSSVLSTWENSGADCGLSILWSHLETSRKIFENLPLFRRNAQIALEGCRVDDLILDTFSTEFQIKFLWGSRGSMVGTNERHAKFTQVLDAMFEKCLLNETD